MVKKENEFFSVIKDIAISKDGFVKYVTEKFQNYTPYLALKKLNAPKITKDIVIQVLKRTFKQDFQENTWNSYANSLISWLNLSGLDIKNKIIFSKLGRGNGRLNIDSNDINTFLPKSSLKEMRELLSLLLFDPDSIKNSYFKDMFFIGIIDNDRKITTFGHELLNNNSNVESLLKNRILELPKMNQLKNEFDKNPGISTKDLISKMPVDFFSGTLQSSKTIFALKALTWLK